MQATIEALASVTAGDLTVTVADGGSDTVGPYIITLTDTTSYKDQLTVNDSGLTGGTGATVIVETDAIPDEIFWAVCEEAMSLLSGRRPDQEYRNLTLTSDGIGSNRVNMDRNDQNPLHTANFITSPTAWKFLSRHLDTRNSFTISRVN
jgi:hypothetical protein